MIHREDSYIHRVSDSIEDTENSFKDDSYIYDEWREWEQSDKNIRKKVQRRGRKLNRTEADLIEKKAALNRAKQAFAEIEGLFVGGNFDRNFDEKGNRLLSRYIDKFLLIR